MAAKITAQEVARHNNAEDLWIVLHGKVYDVTKFVTEHPGGEEVLIALAGQDASKCFDDIGHSEEAIQLKDTYVIGELEGTMPQTGPPTANGKQANGTQANGKQANGKQANGNQSSGNQSNGKQATINDDDWVYEEPKKDDSVYTPMFMAIAAVIYAVIFYYMYQNY